MNLLLLSGFNPFNLDSWRIDRFYKNYCSPRKRNWTVRDYQFIIDYYTSHHNTQPYVLSCHSDGGTLAHMVSSRDDRCVGIHCHAAIFKAPEKLRKVPILLTYNSYDLTTMGFQTKRAYDYYLSNGYDVMCFEFPRNFSLLGHGYCTCVDVFKLWCLNKFNYKVQ